MCQRPRQELNLHARFRKPLLCPLSYGGRGTGAGHGENLGENSTCTGRLSKRRWPSYGKREERPRQSSVPWLVVVSQQLGEYPLALFNSVTYELLDLESPIIEEFNLPSFSRHCQEDHQRLRAINHQLIRNVVTLQLSAEI